MTDTQGYKYATIILAIVAVLLVITLLVKTTTPAPATNSVSDASQSVKTCNDNIAAWRQKYAASTSPSQASADAQTELSNILADCNASIH